MADQAAGSGGGQAAGQRFVQFSRSAAQRIAKAVRHVEQGNRDQPGIASGPRLQQAGSTLRLGTFTGAWATAAYKTVTLAGSTQTASVLNVSSPVANASCERTVVFSIVRGTNVAVEMQYRPTCTTCHISIQGFDLSSLPGYAGGEIQILGHDSSACLTWYSVHQCE